LFLCEIKNNSLHFNIIYQLIKNKYEVLKSEIFNIGFQYLKRERKEQILKEKIETFFKKDT